MQSSPLADSHPHVQVVVVKRKAVIEAFERAIHAFSRPVDPELETGPQQVGLYSPVNRQVPAGSS